MISYDTNILIYALEGQSQWSDPAQAIVRQGEHDSAVLSILAWQELLTGAALNNRDTNQLATILDTFSNTQFVDVTQSICRIAVSLTQQFGHQLYGYDAIHLATAIEYKANVFYTNDKQLLKIHLDQLEIKVL